MEEDAPSEVEYVSEQLDVNGAALEAFSDVFARFQAPPESSSVRPSPLVILFPILTRDILLSIGHRSTRTFERRSYLLRR